MYGVLGDIAPREGVICCLRDAKEKGTGTQGRSLAWVLLIERTDWKVINSKNQKEVSHGS